MWKAGPGGFEGLGAEDGLRRCHELGLDAAEVEFTYGVRMSQEMAASVGKRARELGVELSIHAPYYINLASEEPEKIVASKQRILDSVERGHAMGASFVVFHAGFYGKRDKDEIYGLIKKEIVDLLATIKRKKWTPRIALETTGKPSQFGSLDELKRLSDETGCAVCIDFAHLKARDNGVIDYDAVCKIVKTIEHKTGHFSGIEWTPKGERRHIPTDEKRIEELYRYLKKYRIDMRIINESPQPFTDAALQKRVIRRLA